MGQMRPNLWGRGLGKGESGMMPPTMIVVREAPVPLGWSPLWQDTIRTFLYMYFNFSNHSARQMRTPRFREI